MAYWSIAVLLVSISFLIAKHPPSSWQSLPPWFRSSKTEARLDGGTSKRDRTDGYRDEASEPARSTPALKLSEPDNTEEGESTPKAAADDHDGSETVPSFSLRESEQTPQNPSAGVEMPASPVATKTMPSPLKPLSCPSTSSLMPPPAPKPASLMPPPSRSGLLPQRVPRSNSSLRIPSTGPLPNRGPPTNSAQRAGSSSKGKVQLTPGHSPMDWAALSRDSNLSGVPTLQRVTPSMLKGMTGRKGKPAWSSYQGKVYNMTPYLPFHPGGEPELMKAAGRDGAALFMDAHPWVNWDGMMGQSCLVGIMVSESEAVSQLDEMD